MEDLFFAGLIGRVSVASVVPYILTMQDYKAEPESHMGWQLLVVQCKSWPKKVISINIYIYVNIECLEYFYILRKGKKKM